MWDPRVDVRQNPRHLKNYLWAMTVMCPPDAPPGVAIAEFRSAKGTGSFISFISRILAVILIEHIDESCRVESPLQLSFLYFY